MIIKNYQFTLTFRSVGSGRGEEEPAHEKHEKRSSEEGANEKKETESLKIYIWIQSIKNNVQLMKV